MRMRKRELTCFAGLAAVVFGLALPPLSPAQTREKSPEALIQSVREVVLKHFSQEEIAKALIDALDASLLMFPRSADSEEFASRIGAVRKIFEGPSFFSDKARQYLGFAYRLASGGKGWVLPEELKTITGQNDMMARAKKVCVGYLDSALAERKAGRDLEAVRNLIGFVIMVVTPVEA